MAGRSVNQSKPSVVFIGSGPVAATSLEMLLKWCDIEAVITKPQPPHHKELFPVLDIVQKYELPVHYAGDRQTLNALFADTQFSSRAAVLIDYGVIVSQAVIDHFALGIINSHFSILPEWRGADPISFAILSGQTQTGVSLMLLVPKMDEGPLLAYGEYDMAADITTPELTEDLIELSNALLQRCLPAYLSGSITPAPQSVTARKQSYSRKLSKQDGVLDFSKSAAQLGREIRAFSGWPKSRATIAGRDVIITKAHPATDAAAFRQAAAYPKTNGHVQLPGTFFQTQTHELAVETGDGVLVIDILKPAGKREMSGADFALGYDVAGTDS